MPRSVRGGGSAEARPRRKAGHNESLRLGYSEEDLESVPEGANLGLGCGNPKAIAGLVPGEVVVDLGAGAGFDCFLAARVVGPDGLVIGVDMTPEMVSKARENARKAGYDNVDFRLGEIEHLPVADEVADVIISNCVINLSPDKPAVYREAFRVLKPGGVWRSATWWLRLNCRPSGGTTCVCSRRASRERRQWTTWRPC